MNASLKVIIENCSRLNPGVRGEHLTSQLSWVAAWLLVTHACPVYLVDELVLVFYAPYDWVNGGSVDVFSGWWYGFSTKGEQKIHYITTGKQANIPPSTKQSPTTELHM